MLRGTTSAQASAKNVADELWRTGKIEKVSAELLSLTYGAMVVQLMRDYEDVNEVNKQLDKMGYNIGVRLIEDFLARTQWPRCTDFVETAETIAKIGFRLYLGITPSVSNISADGKELSLMLDDNPLNEFVELPEDLRGLVYSNILCGVIRGALEMVQLQVECNFVGSNDSLPCELRIKLVRFMEDEIPAGDG